MSFLVGILVIYFFMCIQEGHCVNTKNVCDTPAKNDAKSSLAFVFDVTGSMSSQLLKMSENSNLIDDIANSDDFLIDNYILATYNDAVSKVLLNTRDIYTFKSYIAAITTSFESGDFVAGSSMDAIKKALEASQPSSHIYLFTDEASSTNKDLLETVKNFAIKKQSQVDIVVICYSRYISCVDDSYSALAKGTDGKVFDLSDDDFLKVFKYIADSNKSKRTTLLDSDLPPGRHHISYKFDSAVEDVTIGTFDSKKHEIHVDVYKPDGTKAVTEYTIMDVPGYKVFKISIMEPGNYTIDVNSDGGLKLTVTAKSTLDFRHGFSLIKPSSLKATSTQPIAGRNSNILVQLETPEENITLDSIDIVDLDINLNTNLIANVLDEDVCNKSYYATPFYPKNLFKICINAHNSRTTETLSRCSKPIEPQKPESPTYISPSVKILEGPKVVTSYKRPLLVTCQVTGYPKPTVIWENVESGVEMNSSISELEPPYVYVSLLDLSSIEKSGKYRCKASTGSSNDVEVTIEKKFEVVKVPKDLYLVKYTEEATIPCKVYAHPPANVMWYFEDEILNNNENIIVSDDKLVIKHMQPGMVGSYSCNISNAFEKNITKFKVNITDFERPIINKKVSAVTVLNGTKVSLTCNLLAGSPAPQLIWRHLNVDDNFDLQDANKTFVINNVTKEMEGLVITCEAFNAAGVDFNIFFLIVEYPPIIEEVSKSIIAIEGTTHTLHCLADGNPKPVVTWALNHKILVPDNIHTDDGENQLKVEASLENGGKYICEAKNKHGTASQSVEVEYVAPVNIHIPENTTYITLVGEDIVLPCRARGYPEPTFQWIFWNTVSKTIIPNNSTGFLFLANLQLNENGAYTCIASNKLGAANITYYVHVHEHPKIRKDNSKVTVLQGTEVNLRCNLLAGTPTPEIEWTWAHLDVNFKPEVENSSLIIKNVKKEFSSTFTCIAWNEAGLDHLGILLNVEYPPAIKKVSKSIIAVEGTTHTLHCLADGNPKPVVTWALNHKILVPDNIHTDEGDNQLKVRASLEESGKYICKAKNKHGTASHSIDVEYVAPVGVQIPEVTTYTTLVGKDIVLPCRASGYPEPEIQWIFRNTVSKTKIKNNSTGFLFLANLQLNEDGAYTCIASNKLGAANITYYVHVHEYPKIRKDNSTVTVLQGSEVNLRCNLLAGTPTPEITWTWAHLDVNFKLEDANSSLIIKNVKKDFSGTFTCIAWNEAGLDHREISLNVEYPPTIKNVNKVLNKSIIAVEGTTHTLHCLADGNPKPVVTWALNHKILVPDKHLDDGDNQLKFNASLKNSGIYICEAKNKHGTYLRIIEVQYAVPVSIQSADNTTFNVLVGEDIVLPCKSSGYPRPTIVWFFQSTTAAAGQKIFKNDKSGSLSLNHLQPKADGLYTCTASNIAGSAHVAYRVNVHYHPKITYMAESTIIRAMEGDRVLRIPCKVAGNPKPDVTWSLEGSKISTDSQSHDIESDGMLLIKNVDIKSRGYHLCKATNYLGSDEKQLFVDITRFPNYKDSPASYVYVNQGEKRLLDCPLHQEIGSLMRWFKNGVFITEGALVIAHASVEDSGVYICWVDTFNSSKTANVNVTVTSTPEFHQESSLEIQAIKPTIILKPVTEKERTSDKKIKKQRDCALHMQDDFIGNTPFISFDLSMLTAGVFMFIPSNYKLTLSCPRAFTKIEKSKITATCKEGSQFEVDGKVYKFSDLKCTTNMMLKIEEKGFHCGHKNTKTADVGFMVGGRFTPVFEVCFDKMKYVPLYTKLTLHRTFAGVNPKNSKWFNYNLLPFEKEDEKCKNQNSQISSTLKKRFHTSETCCFGKRQLVSPKDVMPGFSQIVTYTDMNVVPQWGTCNSENWNDMEERVRSLANVRATHDLLVWTGQAGQLTLPDMSNHEVNVTIKDRTRQQPVPKYLWKVIQDVNDLTSVAIVQVNIPDLKSEDVPKHVLCRDVCDRVRWMAGGSWTDVTKGYTYCCQLWEFETAFGYKNKFNRDHDLLV